MNPVPVGVNGEIYIGGAGTARGYLNQPELTSDKFFSVSYRTYIPKKIYKTGDLGRWLEDGSIEFFGRMDQQVKIRGFRIELGEIEARLSSHEDIREAVVITGELPGGERYTCAYVVPGNPGEELDMVRLRERLALEMPDYMVPAYLVPMDCIPLTPNGKINRKALPEPTTIAREGFTAPRDEVEKQLADIWAEVLNIPAGTSGIDDNFFEMGGHSLKATVLISKIHKALNIKVPLAEVFKTPSVRGLSDYIKGMVKDRFVSIKPVEDREYYPVSSAQKRLYIQQQLDADNIHYNMPAVVVLEGVLGTDRLETTFKKLIGRHESLRTGFLLIRGEPVQRVHREVDFEIEYRCAERRGGSLCPPFDQDKGSHGELSLQYNEIINDFIRPFDLAHAPLLRLGLVKIEEHQHILMFDMHHIISDGVSLGLFEREFMAVYSAEEPGPLRLQYRDYSQWQNREPETLKTQETYWLSQFEDVPEPLNLPLDFPRPAHHGFKGDTIGFTIEAAETRALDDIAGSVHATRFIILFSIYTIFLSRVTGREDIVVGTPIAGRRHADLGPIMGMFVNTLVLRARPCGEKPFAQFLEEVRDTTLAAFENQDYTFEDLVDLLTPNVSDGNGRNPLFDVMFALRNLDMPEIKIPGLTLKPYPYKKDTSLFDMTLTAMDAAVGGEDRLAFTIEYNTALFKPGTIERFISYFTGIVRTVAANKHIPLQDIVVPHGLRQVKSHNPGMELEI
jgi:acyl carrier protein